MIRKLSHSPNCCSILTRQNNNQLIQPPGPQIWSTKRADVDGEWVNCWVILEISKNVNESSGKIFKILSQKILRIPPHFFRIRNDPKIIPSPHLLPHFNWTKQKPVDATPRTRKLSSQKGRFRWGMGQFLSDS